MRKKRFTEEQIVRLLREQEASGENVQEFCRKQSIATATFYRWKRQMGGMDVSDAQRLKQLERENSRLKKLVAERDLEIEVMKEIEGKKW